MTTPDAEEENRDEARRGGTVRALAFYAAAALVLTWPIAWTLGEASSLRDDYFSNLWNFWWVRTSLVQEQASLYWTEFLHYPLGISLARHTLSPLNAIPGALLAAAFGGHVAFNLLLLTHFWLSGWAFYLFARYVTGHARASLLGGLLYAYCPFHYYYLSQINVFTFEFLPLALLAFVRLYREGGTKRTVYAVLSVALLAASSSYFVIYAALAIGLLLVGGRLLDPGVPFLVGARRLLVGGVGAGLAVLLVLWPLVSSVLGGGAESAEPGTDSAVVHLRRSNDLFGYNWIGPPEFLTVSWPTMLGYGTLLLLAIGCRAVVRQRFWLLVWAFFLMLSLGDTLKIGGEDSGFPLPYRFLSDLPLLSMLRKPDRAFVMVQLMVALFAAFAWASVELRVRRYPRVVWGLVAALLMVELTGVPFHRFSAPVPSYFEELAGDDSVDSIVALPPIPGKLREARYNYFQTVHGKRIAQGYITSLALSEEHSDQGDRWVRGYSELTRGNAAAVVQSAERDGIDVVVLHATAPKLREPLALDRTTVWKPFVFVNRDLLWTRQAGMVPDAPLRPDIVRTQAEALATSFGRPVFQDEEILVFRRP